MKKVQNLFKVGDYVVYPSHGVGKIVEKESQSVGGMTLDLLVIHLEKDKLLIKIPINKAAKLGIRLIVSSREMTKALNILKEKPQSQKGIWSKRAAEYESKIHSGNLKQVAEVIRDLYRDTDNTDRSYSEKVIYDLALERFASEYALLKKLDKKEAIEKIADFITIEKQLA